jgi:hypothetical protein
VTSYNIHGSLYIDDLAVKTTMVPVLRAPPLRVMPASAQMNAACGAFVPLSFRISNWHNEPQEITVESSLYIDMRNGVRIVDLAERAVIVGSLTGRYVLAPGEHATHEFVACFFQSGEYRSVISCSSNKLPKPLLSGECIVHAHNEN